MNCGLAFNKNLGEEKKDVDQEKGGLGKMCIQVKKKLKKNMNCGLAFNEKPGGYLQIMDQEKIWIRKNNMDQEK